MSKKFAYVRYFFVSLYLKIRYLDMNKDKKIERLEQKLAKAQEEIKELKSDVRKAKRSNCKASKKKDARTVTLSKEQQQLLLKLLNGTLTPDS